MRYFELKEDTKPYYDLDIDYVKEVIFRDCQPYLKNKGKGIHLYRGMKQYGHFIEDKLSRSERKPYSRTDLTNKLSELMRKDGFTATRSNSVFCFSIDLNSRFADFSHHIFGRTYYIFPKGDYMMTYHDIKKMRGIYKGSSLSNMDDLGGGSWINIASSHMRKADEDLYHKLENKGTKAESLPKYFWNTFKSVYEQGKSLKDIKSEIMLHTPYYHALAVKSVHENQLFEELLIAI